MTCALALTLMLLAADPSKPSADPAAAKYSSPTAVYDAYRTALQKKDWNVAYDCLTQEKRDHDLFELVFYLSLREEEFVNQHLDPGKLKKARGLDDREHRKQIVAAIRDKRRFYGAAQAHLVNLKAKPSPLEQPLRDVTISDGRARGVVTHEMVSWTKSSKSKELTEHHEPYDMPMHFQKWNEAWLIDLPRGIEWREYAEMTGAIGAEEK